MDIPKIIYLLNGQETKRLLFRSIEITDYDKWIEFFRNPDIYRHWNYRSVNPEFNCTEWYENQFKRYANNEGGLNALIDKESDKLVGHCGLLKQEVDSKYEIEIGYSLLPEFWNKGFATEAALKCRDFAFQNNLSQSLISIISLTNTHSEKVAIKIGMSLNKMTNYKGNEVNIFRINKGNSAPNTSIAASGA